jgi:hypothetical protein
VLTSTPPSLFGIDTFVLTPTAPSDTASFGASPAAWRIGAGAAQLLPAPHAAAASRAART